MAHGEKTRGRIDEENVLEYDGEGHAFTVDGARIPVSRIRYATDPWCGWDELGSLGSPSRALGNRRRVGMAAIRELIESRGELFATGQGVTTGEPHPEAVPADDQSTSWTEGRLPFVLPTPPTTNIPEVY